MILPIVEIFIECSDKLLRETLYNQDYYILLLRYRAICRLMNRRIQTVQFRRIGEIVGNPDILFVECTQQGKRSVEHDARFYRTIHVLECVAYADRTGGSVEESTPHTGNRYRDEHQKRYALAYIVLP